MASGMDAPDNTARRRSMYFSVPDSLTGACSLRGSGSSSSAASSPTAVSSLLPVASWQNICNSVSVASAWFRSASASQRSTDFRKDCSSRVSVMPSSHGITVLCPCRCFLTASAVSGAVNDTEASRRLMLASSISGARSGNSVPSFLASDLSHPMSSSGCSFASVISSIRL